MLSNKDNVDLALRAALVAETVLQFTKTGNKYHAKLIMTATRERFLELQQKVESLPED